MDPSRPPTGAESTVRSSGARGPRTASGKHDDGRFVVSWPAPYELLFAVCATGARPVAPTLRGGIPFGADRRRQAAPHAADGILGAVTASPGAADRGASNGARHDTRKAKAAARRTPSRSAPDQKLPMSPVSGASVSAAGTGGSSGGGLPIFLALPFIAAMLDLARRVALERATWPSGHRRRVPDTPG